MRALAVVTASLFEKLEEKDKHLLSIDDLKIPLALVEGNAPEFDKNEPSFLNAVLVKKVGFSLNYRDLGIIERAWNTLKDISEDTYYPIGSDFSGEVLKVGKNVKQFKKGDVVIGNCSYPFAPNEVIPGIPSNHASREFEVYNENKLVKVPDFLKDIEASGLSIGTQTSLSMIEKASIKEGDTVLVTSITSNTSFFLLNALWNKKCTVYGLSYSGENIEPVKNHFSFIKEVFSIKENNMPTNIAFDVVLDAFSDTYLPMLSRNLNFNARYLTCGVFNQSSKKINNAINANLSILFSHLLAKNISFIGNCLGNTDNLIEGLELNKNHPIKIEKIFTKKDNLSEFITKSYNLDKNKFGKVVYQY